MTRLKKANREKDAALRQVKSLEAENTRLKRSLDSANATINSLRQSKALSEKSAAAAKAQLKSDFEIQRAQAETARAQQAAASKASAGSILDSLLSRFNN